MKKELVDSWNVINSDVKSIIISIGAILLSVALLSFSKWAFPEYDWSSVQAILTTAISGFIVSFVKNKIMK